MTMWEKNADLMGVEWDLVGFYGDHNLQKVQKLEKN